VSGQKQKICRKRQLKSPESVPPNAATPAQVHFFCFVFIFYLLRNFFFVYFVPAALEQSTPAQPAADEEESQGEEQGGQAKRGQGGKSDARWQQKYE
jgi:hypothetical protein